VINRTEFDELLEEKGSAVTEQVSTAYAPASGTPITPAEVSGRLSPALYAQLSEGSESTVIRASERAGIHVGTILSRLGRETDLDDPVTREIVLLFTVYELHMALGHEEAGREYRLKAKDLIVSGFGSFPEAEKQESGSPVGAVTVPKRKPFP